MGSVIPGYVHKRVSVVPPAPRLMADVPLIKALGGGWTGSGLAAPAAVK
jgi:hypothetical protein